MKNSYTKGIEKPNFNIWEFDPLWQTGFTKPPKIIYYELRVWKNHNIIKMNVYTTLKEAIKDYKKYYLEKEDNLEIYVEIVKIDNLNPKYK